MSAPRWNPGDRVRIGNDEYEIVKHLGGGYASEVYQARTWLDGETVDVVLKFPHKTERWVEIKHEGEVLQTLNAAEIPGWPSDRNARIRRAQETRADRTIVALYENGTFEGEPFEVQELAPPPLSHDLFGQPRFFLERYQHERRWLKIMLRVAKAIAIAHAENIALKDFGPRKRDRIRVWWEDETRFEVKVIDWNVTGQGLGDQARDLFYFGYHLYFLLHGRDLPLQQEQLPPGWEGEIDPRLSWGTRFILRNLLLPKGRYKEPGGATRLVEDLTWWVRQLEVVDEWHDERARKQAVQIIEDQAQWGERRWPERQRALAELVLSLGLLDDESRERFRQLRDEAARRMEERARAALIEARSWFPDYKKAASEFDKIAREHGLQSDVGREARWYKLLSQIGQALKENGLSFEETFGDFEKIVRLVIEGQLKEALEKVQAKESELKLFMPPVRALRSLVETTLELQRIEQEWNPSRFSTLDGEAEETVERLQQALKSVAPKVRWLRSEGAEYTFEEDEALVRYENLERAVTSFQEHKRLWEQAKEELKRLKSKIEKAETNERRASELERKAREGNWEGTPEEWIEAYIKALSDAQKHYEKAKNDLDQLEENLRSLKSRPSLLYQRALDLERDTRETLSRTESLDSALGEITQKLQRAQEDQKNLGRIRHALKDGEYEQALEIINDKISSRLYALVESLAQKAYQGKGASEEITRRMAEIEKLISEWDIERAEKELEELEQQFEEKQNAGVQFSEGIRQKKKEIEKTLTEKKDEFDQFETKLENGEWNDVLAHLSSPVSTAQEQRWREEAEWQRDFFEKLNRLTKDIQLLSSNRAEPHVPAPKLAKESIQQLQQLRDDFFKRKAVQTKVAEHLQTWHRWMQNAKSPEAKDVRQVAEIFAKPEVGEKLLQQITDEDARKHVEAFCSLVKTINVFFEEINKLKKDFEGAYTISGWKQWQEWTRDIEKHLSDTAREARALGLYDGYIREQQEGFTQKIVKYLQQQHQEILENIKDGKYEEARQRAREVWAQITQGMNDPNEGEIAPCAPWIRKIKNIKTELDSRHEVLDKKEKVLEELRRLPYGTSLERIQGQIQEFEEVWNEANERLPEFPLEKWRTEAQQFYLEFMNITELITRLQDTAKRGPITPHNRNMYLEDVSVFVEWKEKRLKKHNFPKLEEAGVFDGLIKRIDREIQNIGGEVRNAWEEAVKKLDKTERPASSNAEEVWRNILKLFETAQTFRDRTQTTVIEADELAERVTQYTANLLKRLWQTEDRDVLDGLYNEAIQITSLLRAKKELPSAVNESLHQLENVEKWIEVCREFTAVLEGHPFHKEEQEERSIHEVVESLSDKMSRRCKAAVPEDQNRCEQVHETIKQIKELAQDAANVEKIANVEMRPLPSTKEELTKELKRMAQLAFYEGKETSRKPSSRESDETGLRPLLRWWKEMFECRLQEVDRDVKLAYQSALSELKKKAKQYINENNEKKLKDIFQCMVDVDSENGDEITRNGIRKVAQELKDAILETVRQEDEREQCRRLEMIIRATSDYRNQ